MSLKLGRVRIRIGFLFAAYLTFLICTRRGTALLPLFGSAVAHELGHLLVLLRCGARQITVELHPGGAAIRDPELTMLPYRRLLPAAAAGPAVNLLAASALFLCARLWNGAAFIPLLRVNLMLGGINLLPLSFLDGGVMLRSLLALRGKGPAPPDLTAADLLTLCFLTGFCLFLLLTRRPAYHALAFTAYCIVYIYRKRKT